MVDLPEDFRDLLIALSDAGAEFVVVGGHAVAFHGHPRATKGLDVLVRATENNAKLVYRALAAFGAPLASFEVGEGDFASYDGVLQMGVRSSQAPALGASDPQVGVKNRFGRDPGLTSWRWRGSRQGRCTSHPARSGRWPQRPMMWSDQRMC